MRGALAAPAVAAAVSLLPAPATAEPNTPANASDAQKQLAELSRQAEIITEKVHQAEDAVAAKNKELVQANAEAEIAKNAAAEARSAEHQYRQQVDQLAAASFQGARFDEFAAVLTSGSTQQFLDQMSALDVLAANNKRGLDRLSSVVAAATDADKHAQAAQGQASEAAADAAKLAADLLQRKKDMDQKVSATTVQLNRLTTAERAAIRGQVDMSYINVPPGTAGLALRYALDKRGSYYVWAATGPDTFDCSGLVQWAYRQVNVNLPRSSQAQSTVGAPVSRGDVQAGDLIFFYSDIHHVGIAVDNTRVLHAPQSGDVVRIATIDNMPFHSARRIGS
jgi:cell wall-associated NlpC family hydrolase